MEISQANLRADCANCFGLCCVGPAFVASADFAIDKPAETPCPNLGRDFGCTIHSRLRDHGFPGCTVFDCFGAGQHAAQHTFAGRDWRSHPGEARQMFAAFDVLRRLHELLWHLTEALRVEPDRAAGDALRAAITETAELSDADAQSLLALDVAAQHQRLNVLLRQTSRRVRAAITDKRGRDADGAELIGARLASADLRGVSLRGARLIAADLRGATLRLADVTGADLRGADLRGADLRETLFLTQAQLDAAVGDSTTALSDRHARPAHW